MSSATRPSEMVGAMTPVVGEEHVDDEVAHVQDRAVDVEDDAQVLVGMEAADARVVFGEGPHPGGPRVRARENRLRVRSRGWIRHARDEGARRLGEGHTRSVGRSRRHRGTRRPMFTKPSPRRHDEARRSTAQPFMSGSCDRTCPTSSVSNSGPHRSAITPLSSIRYSQGSVRLSLRYSQSAAPWLITLLS